MLIIGVKQYIFIYRHYLVIILN